MPRITSYLKQANSMQYEEISNGPTLNLDEQKISSFCWKNNRTHQESTASSMKYKIQPT